MANSDFQTFEEFWPFYVKAHAKKTTRIVHFVGLAGATACIASGILSRNPSRKKWLFAVAPVVGYGTSWACHFFLEKNMPGTFKHPLWSMRAGVAMCLKMVRGEMDAEVERVLAEEDATPQSTGTSSANDNCATRGQAIN